MTVDQLRQRYLDFFKSKNHKFYESDSLVPADDPSLLFTGAGMNQFKPYFLGLKKDVKRATSCQKCLRTADLDRVGKTAYHHSFFEMLGNFSFGDYFKEEAIAWGWEFVTKELQLPKDNLWVSVYEEDDEAFAIWKNKIGLPEERIVRMGPDDNFWPANAPKDGPNGPCGPCSEIYVGKVPGKGVEIWNLVFTQFDRQSDGSLKPLPQKNIDTGMGLERAACVLQGVESNFDIDTFKKLRAELKTLLKPGSANTARENAVMDHVRAAVFSIADGALPSNEGRGYVIRKLIRLGTDHLNQAGALKPGQFHKLVPSVIRIMGTAYPDLATKQSTILKVIENEENSFLEVLRTQLPKLENEWGSAKDTAEVAFKYYDTFGLPFELIAGSASARNLTIDKTRFEALLEQQKKRSRETSKIAGEIFSNKSTYEMIQGLPPTRFTGYEGAVSGRGKVLRILKDQKPVDELRADEEGIAIFDQTPFYGESGGQIGDTGKIQGPNTQADVLDVQWIEKCAAHKVFIKLGSLKLGQEYELSIETQRRLDIMKNHTATHLLHAALRKVLGDHVKQSGSLVAGNYLRFDFTHFSGVDKTTLSKIEEMVNAEIKKNTPLAKRVMSKDAAVKEGAMAFFGEKYGDEVRVVSIGDFSMELCGGTHLDNTGQIGLFKIISESSIQAGVRRIEAVTGRWAEDLRQKDSQELRDMEKEFTTTEEKLPARIKELGEKTLRLRNKLQQSVLSRLRPSVEAGLSKATEVNGVKVFAGKMPNANTELLTAAFDHLRGLKVPTVVLWQFQNQDKTTFVVGASPDVVQKGFHSGKVVKEVATIVEGNGGGRPDFAVGGGKNIQKIDEAMKAGEASIRTQLEAVKK